MKLDKIIFFSIYSDLDHVIKSSKNEYYKTISGYSNLKNKIFGKKYGEFARSITGQFKCDERLFNILQSNNTRYKLLYFARDITSKIRKSIKNQLNVFFPNSAAIDACKEYVMPPVKEPVPEGQEIIGDIIEKDGIRYLVELDGNEIPFDDVAQNPQNLRMVQERARILTRAMYDEEKEVCDDFIKKNIDMRELQKNKTVILSTDCRVLIKKFYDYKARTYQCDISVLSARGEQNGEHVICQTNCII